MVMQPMAPLLLVLLFRDGLPPEGRGVCELHPALPRCQDWVGSFPDRQRQVLWHQRPELCLEALPEAGTPRRATWTMPTQAFQSSRPWSQGVAMFLSILPSKELMSREQPDDCESGQTQCMIGAPVKSTLEYIRPCRSGWQPSTARTIVSATPAFAAAGGQAPVNRMARRRTHAGSLESNAHRPGACRCRWGGTAPRAP